MAAEQVGVSASNWTANQHKLMLWLAMPSELREPLTIKALAGEMRVNESTLHRWKQDRMFKQELQTLIMESLGDDFYDVMDAFKKEAKKGSFPHQKMYFEMMGLYVEKRDVTSGGKALGIDLVEVIRPSAPEEKG